MAEKIYASQQAYQQHIKTACEDLKAAYPDVNWKEGKLLNRASKKILGGMTK